MSTEDSSPLAGAVTGSSHTGFQVSDLDRSLDFYCRILRLHLRSRHVVVQPYLQELVGYPGAELHVAFVDIPGSKHWLELLEYRNVSRTAVDPATANPGTAHLCLTVINLPSLYARLRGEGVQFVSPPVMPTVGINQGRLALYLLDPDGIRIELLQLERVDSPSRSYAD